MKYPYEFNPERRRKAKAYTRIRIINGVINGLLIPVAFVYIFLVAGFSVALRGVFSDVISYSFLLLSLLIIAQFPLHLYSGFTLEHRYGLSNQKLSGWFKDYFKGIFLSYLFFLPVVFGLYVLLPLSNWWIYAGISYILLTLLLHYIFPVLIFPFFYKVVPYKDRRMKTRLIKMAARFGKRIDNVFVAKESEKSKKVNAMFSGLGRTKRIILFDNLLSYFRKDEVETVIGHELGHYVNKDAVRYIIIDAVRIFPVLMIIDYVLKNNLGRFGINAISDIASLPLFLLAYFVIELAFMPLLNTYSRYREREADMFGLKAANKPEAQISAEKRLADMDLVDDSPNPLVEFFLFTHPAPAKRIKMVEEWKRRKI